MKNRRSHRRWLIGALALSSLAGVPAMAQPPVVNGWTQFTPSADTRIVYVSASGNDANNGLSETTPKRTLAAAYSLLRNGYPDWLLLKCGDTFYEAFPGWDKSGRSVNEMMRIGSYGTGARPKVASGTSAGLSASAFGSPRAHLAITDIHFVPHTYNGTNGSMKGLEFRANWSDVLIENCYLERYFQNIMFEADPVAHNLSNIRIRRTIVVDAFRADLNGHPQGIYMGGAKNVLLEECVFDHNGWNPSNPGAAPTIFRHNIYIQADCTNITTRGLITARAGATGMQQRGGGLSEGHLVLANPVGIVHAANGTVRDCVVLDSRDIDSSNPRGVGIQITNGANFEMANNVCATRTHPGTWNIVALSFDHAVNNANVHDNVVWKWWVQGGQQAAAMEVWGSPSGAIQIKNNKFQMTSGGDNIRHNISGVPLQLAGNKYYSSNATSFQLGGNRMQFPQWASATGDSGSSFAAASFPDPDRTIATYMAAMGRTPTLAAFMAEARLQSKANWRPEFTAKAAGDYIRAGFGIGTAPPPPTACRADMNSDGILNLNDMVAFQKFFHRGDMRADINGDGDLNIMDFTAYQSLFSAGCP